MHPNDSRLRSRASADDVLISDIYSPSQLPARGQRLNAKQLQQWNRTRTRQKPCNAERREECLSCQLSCSSSAVVPWHLHTSSSTRVSGWSPQSQGSLPTVSQRPEESAAHHSPAPSSSLCRRSWIIAMPKNQLDCLQSVLSTPAQSTVMTMLCRWWSNFTGCKCANASSSSCAHSHIVAASTRRRIVHNLDHDFQHVSGLESRGGFACHDTNNACSRTHTTPGDRSFSFLPQHAPADITSASSPTIFLQLLDAFSTALTFCSSNRFSSLHSIAF